MVDITKALNEFTEIAQEANNKIDALEKKGDTNLSEVKDLTKQMGDRIEEVQKQTLAAEAKLKTQESQIELLEKNAARLGNGNTGDSEDQKAIAEYKETLSSYLRNGGREISVDLCQKAYEAHVRMTGGQATKEQFEATVKTMQSGVGADGGYLILPDRKPGIDDVREFETSPMRAVAGIVSIATDEYEIVIDDDESASGGWVGETNTRSETDTAQLGVIKIPVHEQFAQPKVTQRFLDDASNNVEAYILSKTQDILGRTENTAFVAGNGASKPKGFLSYDATSGSTYERNKIEQINSGSAGAVTYDGLIKLQNGLKGRYQGNAAFMMQRATWEDVLLLKDSENRPLLRPDLLLNGAELRLLGKRVVFADDMPAVATNALSVAYGDMGQAYLIVDRMGMRTLRDAYTSKPFIKFYTTKRVGGAVVNWEAIKLQKLAS